MVKITVPVATFRFSLDTGANGITTQISVDGFAAYPEAVDLAFGHDCSLGVIIKQYKNAKLQYDPSEIVGSIRA